ncbi:alanine dehydrogenase, partial [Anoxybacillus geothermalis]|nr:alanine dehydrogenase [Anoxybacillus geothermalis]
YALQIANTGVLQAITDNPALELGVNVANGEITYEAVARDLGYRYVPAREALGKTLAAN